MLNAIPVGSKDLLPSCSISQIELCEALQRVTVPDLVSPLDAALAARIEKSHFILLKRRGVGKTPSHRWWRGYSRELVDRTWRFGRGFWGCQESRLDFGSRCVRAQGVSGAGDWSLAEDDVLGRLGDESHTAGSLLAKGLRKEDRSP